MMLACNIIFYIPDRFNIFIFFFDMAAEMISMFLVKQDMFVDNKFDNVVFFLDLVIMV